MPKAVRLLLCLTAAAIAVVTLACRREPTNQTIRRNLERFRAQAGGPR